MVSDNFSIEELPTDVYYPKEGFLPEYGVFSVNERVMFVMGKFPFHTAWGMEWGKGTWQSAFLGECEFRDDDI